MTLTLNKKDYLQLLDQTQIIPRLLKLKQNMKNI